MPGFPDQPAWFADNRDFPNIKTGLADIEFSTEEIAGLVGDNLLRLFDGTFEPAP